MTPSPTTRDPRRDQLPQEATVGAGTLRSRGQTWLDEAERRVWFLFEAGRRGEAPAR